MAMTINEKASLQRMLDLCHDKFGDVSTESLVYSSGCDSCTGSCKGHGMSVWTACDIR